MASSKFKSISTEIESENWKGAVHALDDEKWAPLTTSECLGVIIKCCHACIDNKVKSDADDKLSHIIKTCAEGIEELDDKYQLKYYPALFYVIKHLFEQKRVDLILQSEDVIIRNFSPATCTQVISTLNSIATVIHNCILSTDVHNTCTSLVMLLLKLMCLSNPMEVVLEKATFYTPFVSSRVDDDKTFCQFIVDICKLIVNVGKPISDIYSSFSNMLCVASERLIKEFKFTEMQEFVNNFVAVFKKLSRTDSHQQLCQIISCSPVIFSSQISADATVLILQNFTSNLLKFCQNFGLTPETKLVCTVIASMFRTYLDPRKGVKTQVLKGWLLPDIYLGYIKIVEYTSDMAKNFTITCASCKDCNITADLHQAVSIKHIAINLLNSAVANDIDCSEIIPKFHDYLHDFCRLLTKFKMAKCRKWEDLWVIVGIHIYNTASKLLKVKNTHSKSFFLLHLRYKIQFEGFTNHLIRVNTNHVSLKCLSQISLNNTEIRNALTFAALCIFFSDTEDEKTIAFNQWISAKIASKNGGSTAFQPLTVPDVLTIDKKKVKELFPAIDMHLNKQMRIDLLLSEVKHYDLMWPSKEPRASVFNQLQNIVDAVTLAQALVNTWITSLGNEPTNMNHIVEKCLKDLEDNVQQKRSKDNMYLGLMHWVQYRVRIAELESQICEDKKKAPSLLNLANSQQTPNTDNPCEIVSSYNSLKLTRHSQTIQHLNRALELLTKHIPSEPADFLLQAKVYDVVKDIADEYRLQLWSLKSTQAWMLCLKIAKLLGNKLLVFQSIGFVLEFSDLNTKAAVELLEEANKLVEIIQNNDNAEAYEKLTMFYINKSFSLLKNQNVREGFVDYNKAHLYFDKLGSEERENKRNFLKIKLDYLFVQYLMLPCKENIQGHNMFSLMTLHKLLFSITAYFKSEGATTVVTCTLLEIGQYITRFYFWLRLPREVRCYGRDSLDLAQELVVPLRAADLLIYIANADTANCRFVESQTKLQGLSDILCLDGNGFTPIQCKNEKKPTLKVPKIAVENVTEGFREMFLDAPVGYSELSGSPSLPTKSFKLPDFIKHEDSCHCLFCTNVDYQLIVLATMNAGAYLNLFLQDNLASEDNFNGAIRYYSFLEQNANSFSKKATQLLGVDVLSSFKTLFCQDYCWLLLNYGNYLLQHGNNIKAMSINSKLVECIASRKYENHYFYNEVLYQKLNIQYEMIFNENDQNAGNLLAELNIGEDVLSPAKTPYNSKSPVNSFLEELSWKCKSPIGKPIKKYARKAIKFDEYPGPESKIQKTAKKPKQYRTKTPYKGMLLKDDLFVVQPKTPKRTPLGFIDFDALPLASKSMKNTKAKTGKKSTSDSANDKASAGPSSSIAQTPCSQKDTNFMLRTKMLTEKLKQSQKSVVAPASETKVLPAESDKNNRITRNTARKNLLSDLSEPLSKARSSKNSNKDQAVDSKVPEEKVTRKGRSRL